MRYTFFFWFILIGFGVSFAQKDNEFSLLKTPEQKELEKEEQYLKFQDHFFKALKERAQENYDLAIEALNDCEIIYPNHVAVNFEYAKNYLDLKQYQNALDFVNKTLKQKPKERYVLQIAVKINRFLRNYSKAVALQKELVKINPDYKNGLVYLLILNNEKEQAKEVYAQLEKEQLLDNRKDYFKRVLFKSVNAKKPKKPVAADITSVKREKELFYKNKSFKNLKPLLIKEEKLKKYNELLIDSSEGLSLFPAQPFVYYMNGLALNTQKRFKDAIESLQSGLDFVLDEDQKQLNKFYKQLIVAYQGLGDTKNATKYRKKIQN